MKPAFKVLPLLLLCLSGCGDGGEGGPTTAVLAERGRTLYQQRGCVGCHTVDGTPRVGPSWKGLYGREVELVDGSRVRADEEYLKESILEPSAKTVAGFQPGLMETVIKPNSFTEEEVAALVAYIKGLD